MMIYDDVDDSDDDNAYDGDGDNFTSSIQYIKKRPGSSRQQKMRRKSVGRTRRPQPPNPPVSPPLCQRYGPHAHQKQHWSVCSS